MSTDHHAIPDTYEYFRLARVRFALIPSIVVFLGFMGHAVYEAWVGKKVSDIQFFVPFMAVIVLQLLTLPVIDWFVRRHNFRVWATYNFAWYKATFPTMVDERSRVKCRHCGSRSILVENLYATFVRRHHCGTCGETLYFSPVS